MNGQAPQWLDYEPRLSRGLCLNVRSEGMGVRATARSFGKPHSMRLRWEQRLANQVESWSPPAPEDREVTLEDDEVYTYVGENLTPREV